MRATDGTGTAFSHGGHIYKDERGHIGRHRMEPALILVMMLLGWLTVALAMLWGMMRIVRHHQPHSGRPAESHPPHDPADVPALPSLHA